MECSKEQVEGWLNDPITKLFQKYLQSQMEEAKEQWSRGMVDPDKWERALGWMDAYRAITEVEAQPLFDDLSELTKEIEK